MSGLSTHAWSISPLLIMGIVLRGALSSLVSPMFTVSNEYHQLSDVKNPYFIHSTPLLDSPSITSCWILQTLIVHFSNLPSLHIPSSHLVFLHPSTLSWFICTHKSDNICHKKYQEAWLWRSFL